MNRKYILSIIFGLGLTMSNTVYGQTEIVPKDVEVRMGQNRKSQKPTCQDSLNQEKTTSKIGLKYKL